MIDYTYTFYQIRENIVTHVSPVRVRYKVYKSFHSVVLAPESVPNVPIITLSVSCIYTTLIE